MSLDIFPVFLFDKSGKPTLKVCYSQLLYLSCLLVWQINLYIIFQPLLTPPSLGLCCVSAGVVRISNLLSCFADSFCCQSYLHKIEF